MTPYGANRMTSIADAIALLPTRYRNDASTMRSYGDERGAVMLERVAAEIEHAIATAHNEALTLRQAAEASGYSTDHLSRLVRTARSITSAARARRACVAATFSNRSSARRRTKRPRIRSGCAAVR